MKKNIATLLILTFLIPTFALSADNFKKIKIRATIFPEYDWLCQIAKNSDGVEIELLAQNGADMHSFQPSAKDIVKIQTADVFVYTGGESEQWIKKVLVNSKNKSTVTINLAEILDGNYDEDDEHIWLSLKNAKLLCSHLVQKLCALDEKNASLYKANFAEYKKRLTELDNAYEESAKNAKKSAVLVADRFPFKYLFDDYGIQYFAAFPGCHAESEASFEKVIFLSKKIDELGLKYILKTESSDGTMAKTIIANSKTKNAEVVTMNSMQSVNYNAIKSGISYLQIMTENLEALKKALE